MVLSFTPLHGIQSQTNTTTALLSGGATFTGAAERNNVPDVMCSCFADVAGTLYFDFSVNGTDWRTFPVNGYSVAAGIHEFHVARKGPRYFRVRFVNGASAQSTFQLYVYYGWFGQPMAPIGFTIADDADAIVTKSVLSGVGDTTATVTDHQALQVSPPPEGKSAFGEALASSLDEVIGLIFAYNLNPLLVTTQNNNSGSAAVVTSMAQLSSGAAANSSSYMKSNQNITYQPGMGVRARYTSMFTTGVAGSTQISGLGGSDEGYFFGFNGADFGILRRYGGKPEVRTLTVTTGSSTAENITITLDGDADATVAVTNTGDTTLTANEIAAHDYSDLGRGWTAKAVGATVVFTSWDSSSRTGAYSLSGATTAVGTFAQTLAGVAATDVWVNQADWNGLDIFNGNGLTGVTLDPTKLNVFQIDFQYLGAGAIRFYIEDPDDGELHLVHTIEYANANTRPSIDNPSIGFFIGAENTTNTTDISISSASAGVFIDGKRTNGGIKRGITGNLTLGATSAETPITSFRLKEVYQGMLNRSEVKINYISVSVEHSKPCAINFYANATLTGASFSDLATSTSSIEQDTSATAFTGGVLLFSLYLGKTGQTSLDLKDDLTIGAFGAGNTITATLAPTSGNSAEGNVSFNVTEKI